MKSATTSAGLVIEDRDAVRTLTIDRPDRANSLDRETARAVTAALRSADDDPAVRAVVLTATGKWFCTGADLSAPTSSPPAHTFELARQPADYFQMVRTAWEIQTPMITALNGGVYGIGVALAFTADLVVAKSGATVAHLFAERGLPAHAGDAFVLSRVFPAKRLAEFSLLGRRFTVEDLERWGVVNWVVDEAELESTVDSLACELASGPTVSLGISKRLYRRAPSQDADTALTEDAMALAMVKSTHDYQEGYRAFGEHRPAEFLGR